MSCRDESHDHDHHHGHGHEHGHEGHDHDGPDRGFENFLYQQIAIDRIICLNESQPDSAKKIFKSWEMKLDRTDYLESDVDEQLIIHVPFNAIVKLKSILIRTGPDSTHAPNKMKVWINREDVDFELAETLPVTQEWDIVTAEQGLGDNDIPEYWTRMAKFNNVRSITLFFPGNYGDEDVTRVDFIGFKGEWEEMHENPVVTVYELNANPADHPKITEKERKFIA